MRRTSSRGGTIRYTPVPVSSCRWQVDTGRRRDGVAIYHPINRGLTKWTPPYRLHGQGWQFDRNAALSSGVRRRRNPPRRAHDFRRKYHRPFGVVSKCAFREKREAPRFPGTLPAHRTDLNTSHRKSSSCSKVILCTCGKAFSKIAPSWMSLRVRALRSFTRSRA